MSFLQVLFIDLFLQLCQSHGSFSQNSAEPLSLLKTNLLKIWKQYGCFIMDFNLIACFADSLVWYVRKACLCSFLPFYSPGNCMVATQREQ